MPPPTPASLLKRIKQAEDDLERTNHAFAWTSDANLKYVKDRIGHVKRLEERVAKLNAQYRELEMKSRTHGGRRTRRRHRTRSTRRR